MALPSGLHRVSTSLFFLLQYVSVLIVYCILSESLCLGVQNVQPITNCCVALRSVHYTRVCCIPIIKCYILTAAIYSLSL